MSSSVSRMVSILRPSVRMRCSMSDNALAVIHDQENMEFYINLEGNKAYLQYDILNTETKAVDLLHTVVPEAFRGHGIGKVLAKEAFDHFVGRNQPMKLTCWYLKKYYQDNPLPQYKENIITS